MNTKALIYILFTNNNICRSFAMCAHKTVLEDVWLFKTLWRLELVYPFKGSRFILFFRFGIAWKRFIPECSWSTHSALLTRVLAWGATVRRG